MLSLLFKAITPETSLWEGHTALITGAAREGNPLSGRCSGTGYRGQYCRNVTIHPPDNAFPGSCTKTEQRKRGICMAAAPQSLDRNSGGALYARGKKSLSQFFLSSQRRNHPRQSCCSSVTTSDSGTLCPSLRVPHRAASLPGKSAPQNRTPQTPCPTSQAGQKGITSCTAGPGASPAPAQADPGLKPVGSTVCSTLVLMSFLWWWPWMQPPGHQRNLWPLTAVLIPLQSLPRACLLLPSLES